MEDKNKISEEFEEIEDLELFAAKGTSEKSEPEKAEVKKPAKLKRAKLSNEKIAIISAAAVVIIALGVFFGIKLIHRCDNCGKIFFGTGYVGSGLNQLVDRDYICCKDCAEKKHAWEISIFGGNHSLDEFKKPFFGSSERELEEPEIQNE